MSMRIRLARLFTIKTRTEALFITYAIAVGSIERGLQYIDQYPGYAGFVLALACLGVPFIAGAKLIDSVKNVSAPAVIPVTSSRRRSTLGSHRNRPNGGRLNRDSFLRASRRSD